ncbi:hypothetical protein [Aquabacterium sp.]|uniref:hypothetical protein n=1 Tax=Aquabacterium sp. TaxID=1872578 RepID=UPI0037833483
MASIHREISIDTPADRLWQAARDIGALHTRLVPGFVSDCRLEDEGAARRQLRQRPEREGADHRLR